MPLKIYWYISLTNLLSFIHVMNKKDIFFPLYKCFLTVRLQLFQFKRRICFPFFSVLPRAKWNDWRKKAIFAHCEINFLHLKC